jgi:hypothetical protein
MRDWALEELVTLKRESGVTAEIKKTNSNEA